MGDVDNLFKRHVSLDVAVIGTRIAQFALNRLQSAAALPQVLPLAMRAL